MPLSFQVLKYDFALGIQYALNLLIFTLTTTFSLVTPLIVPFGKFLYELSISCYLCFYYRSSLLCCQVFCRQV